MHLNPPNDPGFSFRDGKVFRPISEQRVIADFLGCSLEQGKKLSVEMKA
jgi:hypothetical protein